MWRRCNSGHPDQRFRVDVAASVCGQMFVAWLIYSLTLAAAGTPFPFSSIVERPAVNRDDAGANPATGAISRAWERSSLPTTGSVTQGGPISRIPKKKSSTPTLNHVEAIVCENERGAAASGRAPQV